MTIHSRYGGSIIGTIIGCNGYPNATSHIKNSTSAAAEKGTAEHECAEFCIKTNIHDAHTLIGCEFNGYVIDDDMADGVNVYTQHIRSLMLKHPNAKIYVEPRVTMSSVHRDEVFGYIDCLIIVIDDGIMYVSDYKGGRVIVDVNENAQIAHYAISALDTYKLWFSIHTVIGTIIQPHMEHADGIIRTWTMTIEDLYKWRDIIVEAIRKSKSDNAERTAGKWCTYCPVRGECRTRVLHTFNMVYGDKPFGNMSDEEIALILPELPAIKKSILAIEERALELARSGKQIDWYKLVRARQQAKCTDEAGFIAALKEVNPTVDTANIYWTGKIKGKTELKKHYDKKTVDKFFPAPDASTSLVPLSNPSSAIATNAAQAFKGIKL